MGAVSKALDKALKGSVVSATWSRQPLAVPGCVVEIESTAVSRRRLRERGTPCRS